MRSLQGREGGGGTASHLGGTQNPPMRPQWSETEGVQGTAWGPPPAQLSDLDSRADAVGAAASPFLTFRRIYVRDSPWKLVPLPCTRFPLALGPTRLSAAQGAPPGGHTDPPGQVAAPGAVTQQRVLEQLQPLLCSSVLSLMPGDMSLHLSGPWCPHLGAEEPGHLRSL